MKLMQETRELAGPLIEQDVKMDGNALKTNVLEVVVYYIHTSQDLQDAQTGERLPELGGSVMTEILDLPQATAFSNCTHLLAFRPEGTLYRYPAAIRQ